MARSRGDEGEGIEAREGESGIRSRGTAAETARWVTTYSFLPQTTTPSPSAALVLISPNTALFRLRLCHQFPRSPPPACQSRYDDVRLNNHGRPSLRQPRPRRPFTNDRPPRKTRPRTIPSPLAAMPIHAPQTSKEHGVTARSTTAHGMWLAPSPLPPKNPSPFDALFIKTLRPLLRPRPPARPTLSQPLCSDSACAPSAAARAASNAGSRTSRNGTLAETTSRQTRQAPPPTLPQDATPTSRTRTSPSSDRPRRTRM